MKRILRLTLFLLSALGLSAQTTDPLVYTVGKTFPNGAKNIDYILWQPGNPAATFGKKFAIYRKAGISTAATPYTLLGKTQIQTSPAVAHSLLKLGDQFDHNASSVADRINTLYAEVTSQPGTQPAPPVIPGLPEAQKLSHLLNIAATDIKVMERLFFLGRAHPGIYMALGHGFAISNPPASIFTYEVREINNSGNDLRVIGRVTLDASAPTNLVPTTRPYQVLHKAKADHQEVASPRDHLVARLRWGMSDPLRRLLPHTFGYNLYRVREAVALSNSWNGTAPTVVDLENLIANSFGNPDPDAKRINSLPIFAAEIMTEVEAADTVNNRETVFTHDDNDPPLNPFENGDTFYYFVAARDIAGYPGPISLGTRVVICDRLPPTVPIIHSIRNIYETATLTSLSNLQGNQHFRIRIRQTPDLPTKNAATNYKIYRWSDHTQHIREGGDPSAHLVATVSHVSGEQFVDWDDNGVGAPTITPADSSQFGKTWWFTVRAEDDAACLPKNLSGHSPPAFGVLRDRVGPDTPTGFVTRCRYLPRANFDDNILTEKKSDLGLADDFEGFVIRYTRLSEQISGFELEIIDTELDPDKVLFRTNRFFTLTDLKNVVVPFLPTNNQSLIIRTRARTDTGLMSAWIENPINLGTKKGDDITVIPIILSVFERCYQIPNPAGGTPPPHDVVGPNGAIVGPEITITIPVDSAEYRIYRRVGHHGSFELISRGSGTALPSPLPDDISFIDPAPPTAGGTEVCYFAQVFDQNGNSGPRVKLGCVTIKSADLATPILSDAEYLVANATQAQLKLSWFCDPVGVERFEIWAASDSAADPEISSVLIGPKLDTLAGALLNDDLSALAFCGYQTKTIASNQIGSGAEFSVILNVPASQTQTFVIRAVGKGGYQDGDQTRPHGPFSNAVTGAWQTPSAANPPIIPWPDLSVPNVAQVGFNVTSYQPGEGPFYATHLSSPDTHSAAILMGVFASKQKGDPPSQGYIDSERDPLDLFFSFRKQNVDPLPANGLESIIPFAVYRHQLPSAAYPQAVPNLVQVSPLIDRFAYSDIGNDRELRDPFFRIVDFDSSAALLDFKVPVLGKFGRETSKFSVSDPAPAASSVPYLSGNNASLWWVDPMPVVQGARYQYLIVHFTKRGEIDRVIPTNPVDQP